MASIRSFVAVSVKGLPSIEQIANEMRNIRGVKGVKPENIHLTLKFLGNIDEDEDVPRILESLRDVATRHQEFTVTFQGTGGFPNINRMRVAWIGLKGEALEKLTNDVIRTLPSRDDEKPQRFKPHLTVGRIKFPEGRRKAQRILEDHKNEDFGTLQVRSFELMQSTLTPQGPIYSVIESFPLIPSGKTI